jgi:hypothetical protein
MKPPFVTATKTGLTVSPLNATSLTCAVDEQSTFKRDDCVQFEVFVGSPDWVSDMRALLPTATNVAILLLPEYP